MITFYKQISHDPRVWHFIIVPDDVLTMSVKKDTTEEIKLMDRWHFFNMLQYKIYKNTKLKNIKSGAVL